MENLDVLIVGAGLGGLSCAIGCRRKGLKVTVLERDAKLTEFGAGIQLPPNAARVMRNYGLLETLIQKGGALCSDFIEMRRYDGEILTRKPTRMRHWLGFDQYTIHRVDYQRLLVEEAERLDVVLRFDCKVNKIICNDVRPSVTLEDGEVIEADVIVGADGMFSTTREAVLGQNVRPEETGDLAWRATITRAQIEASGHLELIKATREQRPLGWLGPSSHVVFYPLRNGDQYNLVLARPDDLPMSVVRQEGDLTDLRAFFADWDPVLNTILSQVSTVQKWKLLHLQPLETWNRGAVALMGDACHPTLPYQAQGAAMAVEDGASIAEMLGLLIKKECSLQSRGSFGVPPTSIIKTLHLYQQIRKQRTDLNVCGAESNRIFLHMPLGPDLEARDQMLREWDWEDLNAECEWPYCDPTYARKLMDFDVEAEARVAFEAEFGCDD